MHWKMEVEVVDILAKEDIVAVVRSEELNSRMDSLLDT